MLKKIWRDLCRIPGRVKQEEREQAKYESVWKDEEYRQFSPGLRSLHVFDLPARLRNAGVKTVLDAGCGSGKLMKALIEIDPPAFKVRGLDIATNCLDAYFRGRESEFLDIGCLWDPTAYTCTFDAVICVDVLEHIPTEKIPAVLENLRKSAGKYCYLGIALHHDHYGPKLLGEPLHLTVKEPSWWFAALERAGFPTPCEHVIERADDGRLMWLHVFTKFESLNQQE